MKIWILLACQIIRRALKSPDLWAYLEETVAVIEATQQTLSGTEKRGLLGELLAGENPAGSPLAVAIASVSGWLLNLAIEAIVARLRVAAPDPEVSP